MARRAATLALSVLAAALGAVASGGAALGQTVADFEDALAKAPISDAKAAVSAAHCRPLMNYVYTSMPGEGRVAWTLPLYTIDGAANADLTAKRGICGEVRAQAVIAFDGGTGEPILTPAQALENRDTNQPYYREPPPTGPGGEVIVPRTGRATPQNPIRRTP